MDLITRCGPISHFSRRRAPLGGRGSAGQLSLCIRWWYGLTAAIPVSMGLAVSTSTTGDLYRWQRPLWSGRVFASGDLYQNISVHLLLDRGDKGLLLDISLDTAFPYSLIVLMHYAERPKAVVSRIRILQRNRGRKRMARVILLISALEKDFFSVDKFCSIFYERGPSISSTRDALA